MTRQVRIYTDLADWLEGECVKLRSAHGRKFVPAEVADMLWQKGKETSSTKQVIIEPIRKATALEELLKIDPESAEELIYLLQRRIEKARERINAQKNLEK